MLQNYIYIHYIVQEKLMTHYILINWHGHIAVISHGKELENIVTDLLRALLGNGSVNMASKRTRPTTQQ
jgi:hypothetical protein